VQLPREGQILLRLDEVLARAGDRPTWHLPPVWEPLRQDAHRELAVIRSRTRTRSPETKWSFRWSYCFYESSLRAGHGWRESLYRHQGCLKASNCGRLGRQAAGHPWSALRVVKSCRKDCPTAEVLPRPKQQLCIQNGIRAYYLNYLQKREGEAGKRSAGNRIG
jgi:hypothetical protein